MGLLHRGHPLAGASLSSSRRLPARRVVRADARRHRSGSRSPERSRCDLATIRAMSAVFNALVEAILVIGESRLRALVGFAARGGPTTGSST